MAHAQQIAYCTSVRERYPAAFKGKRVLDVGSLDINGNNRYLFTDCTYIGIDVVPGRNVDIVDPLGMAHYYSKYRLAYYSKHRPLIDFDTIISTEALEHDREWSHTLAMMVMILKPGGLLLVTAATTGRGEHGTARTTPHDAPGLPWQDYYQNVTEAMIRSVLDIEALFSEHEIAIGRETCDIYFCGIRREIA